MRTRFAPSPTGYLHVGGARTALFNWLLARHHGGEFILRIEDTDQARNTESARGAILDGLRWLGLDWDEGPLKNSDSMSSTGNHGPYYQSQRQSIYDQAFEELQQTGRVYEDNGAWRFRFERKTVVLEDLVCGQVSVDFTQTEITPDMTIKRPDGSYIFHFVNVVDDLAMGISHVVRGEDHLTNTHKHLQLFEAFNAPAPSYAHVPLILNENGSKMSKRDQGAALAFYQQEGFSPEGVVNYLSLLGWNPNKASDSTTEQEIFSLQQLIERFDLADIHRSNAAFDLGKCRWMSAQHLQKMSAETLELRTSNLLENAGIQDPETRTSLLELCRPRLEVLEDLSPLLAQFCNNTPEIDPATASKAFGKEQVQLALQELATALEETTQERWQQDSLQQLIKETAGKHELKPGKLMFPLRVATTGATGGLDLLPMLCLLPSKQIAARIRHSLLSIEGTN